MQITYQTSRLARWGRRLFLSRVGYSYSRLRVIFQSLLLLLLSASTSVSSAMTLSADTELATAGYFQLNWYAQKALHYQLEEARDRDFAAARLLYQGEDQATMITGQANGDYFYRVRALLDGQQYGAWSDPVKVTVQHHDLRHAFAFFAVGILVFIAILIAILMGNKRAQQQAGGEQSQ